MQTEFSHRSKIRLVFSREWSSVGGAHKPGFNNRSSTTTDHHQIGRVELWLFFGLVPFHIEYNSASTRRSFSYLPCSVDCSSKETSLYRLVIYANCKLISHTCVLNK